MKILVVGQGGREHALAWKILQSPNVNQVFIAPGNAGMLLNLPKLTLVNVKATDIEGLLQFALKEKIDLTVVGPETSLEKGLQDLFVKNGLVVFGPSKAAAQLESSKTFAKEIMRAAKVPTAEYKALNSFKAATEFIESTTWAQMVVKVDGLAAGKGVVVCANKAEAFQAVKSFMVDGVLGFKAQDLLIEEYLVGPEVSVFALSDGNNVTFLGSAGDHKRLRDHDQGPNTGGMGVISPSPFFKDEDQNFIMKTVMEPIVCEMKKRGTPFSGVLFAGLIKTPQGYKTLEFNVRFGDPETQALMTLIDEDIVPWFLSCAQGELLYKTIKMKREKAIHVVMAAHGYPGTEGVAIRCGDQVFLPNAFEGHLFFAGVDRKDDLLVTSGGRVLGLTCRANSYPEARKKVYTQISKIKFEGAQYRTDIGAND